MIFHFRSYYSLRFGTLSHKNIVELAVKAGISKLVLADINNSTAWSDVYKACKNERIDFISGMEFRKDGHLLFICIAKNREGFQEINEYLTQCNLRKAKPADHAPPFNNVYVLYPMECGYPEKLRDNEYIAVRSSLVNRLVQNRYRKLLNRMVAWVPISFHKKEDYDIHKHLRAIDNNCLLPMLKDFMLAHEDEYISTVENAKTAFTHEPILLENAEEILRQCSFDLNLNVTRNKKVFTSSRYDDKLLLEKLTFDGFPLRYPGEPEHVRKRINKELEAIDRLGFSSYFLMAWDIIRYSMSQGFYHVGRGSGANSIVAYCLYITNVDPVELNLYFERFINPKRSSPPDFDIDFSWKDRDNVQEYIFKRYGSRHTALLGMMQTFRDKSVYRELGKVYGLPKAEIDAMVNERKSLKAEDKIIKKIISVAKAIRKFPNLRSIHAGGILISEDPITMYSALDLPPKGLPTVQWDMYTAEGLGYEKFDILSQRGIGHIGDSIKLIAKNRKEKVDIHNIPALKEDPLIPNLIEKGETIGCFYVESPAMRNLLKKLRCRDYLSLVAASSIIRPGVSSSGMMSEYIRRFHFPENVTYPHPILKELLQDTFGIMVYQEDVLKVIHHYAGMNLADADILRRAMSGKYRSKTEMQRIVNKFHKNAAELGRPTHITKELWRQIESFSGYSFSKAHSASFAVESFQSIFIKAYYPLEFMTSVINNFGGYYRSWIYFAEAQRLGGMICTPCINEGSYLTTLHDQRLIIGFIHIKSLEKKFIKSILRERQINGKYINIHDFMDRNPTNREQIILLIRSGAFAFTGKAKPELLWEVFGKTSKKAPEIGSKALFPVSIDKYELPNLVTSNLENAYDEAELIGFPVSLTWFEMLQSSFRGEIMCNKMGEFIEKRGKMLGVLLTIKPVRTKKNEIMYFTSFMDAEGHFFEAVHFPQSLKQYPFRGNGVYLLLGKVVDNFGTYTIEVEKMAKMTLKSDPRG